MSASEFLSNMEALGDFSDDLLEAINQQLAAQNWSAICKLVWAVQRIPDRKFAPLLCDLLDNHRHDVYMEAIADALLDIHDERSVPPGDSSYIPPSGFVVSKGFGAFVVTTYPPTNGVILYEAHNLELTIASYAAFALIAASASLQMEVGVSQELALAGGL
ncbi:MAG TPA: hypothetical protein VFQ43_10610 [Nitrososphaera sp.]|nr:hypothetical protein [Nitrososphaera sp.]